MAAGMQPSKADVDGYAGAAARDVNLALVRAGQFATWLAGQVDADLTALGYSASDIANLRSTFADMAALYQVYTGAQPQAAAKDFRQFARRIWGFGF